MAFAFKYYEGVLKGQAELSLNDAAPPFDIGRMRGKPGFVSRLIKGGLEKPDWWLGLFRRFWPRARLGRVVLLTRFEDVREVLEREADFETPYGMEMREFGGGANFILGMKDSEAYRRQKSAVLTAFPPREIEERVRPIARENSRQIVKRAGEKFDAAGELMRIVPVRICRDYYGLHIEDDRQFGDWALALSNIFFADATADRTTRELAVAAAQNMLATINRSIDLIIAKGKPDDRPLGRLVQMLNKGEVSGRDEICSIMMGMITGFMPTNLLGGINCLDVVLDKPEAFDCIRKAVLAEDNTRLEKAIVEAMRFKPIWIWPWRYAAEDRTIGAGRSRPFRIRSGTTVLAATRSAMFDTSKIADPWTFNPDRNPSESMVFGHGIHTCIGIAMARVQIGEAFRALFEKPGFRRAHGKEGKLVRIGAYPDTLMVEFDQPAENRQTDQALVTVCVPVRPGVDASRLQQEIDTLGNPATDVLKASLDKTAAIHFASLSAVSTADGEARQDGGLYLMLELSGDGTRRQVIKTFAEATATQFQPLFERFSAVPLKGSFEAFLQKHTIDVSPQFGSLSGLVFAGTPGHSVSRIQAEAALADEASNIVEGLTGFQGPPAAEILKTVRTQLAQDSRFDWAFAPAPSLLEKPGGSLGSTFFHSVFNLRTALPLAILVAILTFLTYAMMFDASGGWFRMAARIGSSLVVAVGGLVLTTLALATAIAVWLRRIEQRDDVSATGISLDALKQLQQREDADGYTQNHMTAVSIIKPGMLRVFLLGFSFYIISIAASRAFRPGYLGDINTIHFARWVRIPGTNRLVFFSNYGGSWESYLEDFVTKASAGLTGVWSNTKGFPRTRFLFLDGSRDGDRFKRWARAEQIPTSFWYSAYPKLNTTLIRKNSRIRQGLCAARMSEARDWVSLFTSLPRQDGIKLSLPQKLLNQAEDTAVESLENGEIQSLVFGPLGNLEHAKMFAFAVGDKSSVEQREGLLDYLVSHVSFGDAKPAARAMFCVFGPDGLKKLGLAGNANSDPLASFPLAFRQGMADQYRSRILDDRGDSAPELWRWGSVATPVDLAMVCYAATKELLDEMGLEMGNLAARSGLVPRAVIPLSIERGAAKCPVGDPARKEREDSPMAREHFGFVDGISQPVIKGTRRRRTHNSSPIHQIAAGEFLFGYRDEHGFYPPSPTTPAEFDREGRLLAIDDGGQPVAGAASMHDFGRNGSFVVIRQLEQHVDAFNDYCHREAAGLRSFKGFEGVDAEWIGARIVGRWKNGSSLTRNPDSPGRELDNQFTYGAEDPQGLHCPLGAHIRRSNPRDSLGTDIDTQLRISKRHRILRAGRSYVLDKGEGTAAEKGLLFICFNASFERQYEFIQQTWMSAQNFHGLRGEKDPLIGRQRVEGEPKEAKGRFTIPRWEGAVELTNLPSFITMRGGGYFFMPSRAALQYLRWRMRGG